MLNPAPKKVGGRSQNHLKSYLQVPKTVTREEAYKGVQKLQTYIEKSPYYAMTGQESVMPAERLFNKKPTAEFEPMDVSGEEPAPEPDVVMDSNEDFEPGESEDEAVPQNIEIARNLQKTQTDMVKQVGKTWREDNYQISNWVSLDKEPRSGLSKMDAV